MTEAIDFVKTDLMPDFDFDAFNHDNADNYEGGNYTPKKEEPTPSPSTEEKPDDAPTGIAAAATPEIEPTPQEPTAQSEDPSVDSSAPTTSHKDEEVDKW